MEIPRNFRANQRNLRLDKGFRDAVAEMLRQRWPSGTAKHAARAFNLSLDRAREAAAGRASLTTVEQIVKQGGPPVALPILEAVWGGSLAHYFAELRKAHEDHGERLAALFGDGRVRSPGDPDRADRGHGLGADGGDAACPGMARSAPGSALGKA